MQASLGCGNPTGMVDIHPGQVVLDLGSGLSRTGLLMFMLGGGIDCLFAAKRVGSTGKVYGLDMTPEMVELARRNAIDAGVTNVEFLLGGMEAIPLADESVDVIISNCVINLANEKDAVLKEAFRVLKKGGKLAVSDIVLKIDLPDSVKENMAMWTGCVAGALRDKEYLQKLRDAGFSDASVEEVRIYGQDDVSIF